MDTLSLQRGVLSNTYRCQCIIQAAGVRNTLYYLHATREANHSLAPQCHHNHMNIKVEVTNVVAAVNNNRQQTTDNRHQTRIAYWSNHQRRNRRGKELQVLLANSTFSHSLMYIAKPR